MTEFEITPEDKKSISSIIDRMEVVKTTPGSNTSTLSFEVLYNIISPEEKATLEKCLQINPLEYGFKGGWLGITDVPQDLVYIDNQKYIFDGKETLIPTQSIPQSVFDAYTEMNQAIQKDLSVPLLIESSYRSPAYQMVTLFYYLKLNDFDLDKTLKRVAMPGYSEHNYPPKQALDFITQDGNPSDEDPLKFAQTREYQWLLENATTYHFYLSYPENNTKGIMYEPWHWRYEE